MDVIEAALASPAFRLPLNLISMPCPSNVHYEEMDIAHHGRRMSASLGTSREKEEERHTIHAFPARRTRY